MQAVQEHIQKRIVSSNPLPPSSIHYITCSFKAGDIFSCTSPLNIGSTKSTVFILGYIQSSITIQLPVNYLCYAELYMGLGHSNIDWKVGVGDGDDDGDGDGDGDWLVVD